MLHADEHKPLAGPRARGPFRLGSPLGTAAPRTSASVKSPRSVMTKGGRSSLPSSQKYIMGTNWGEMASEYSWRSRLKSSMRLRHGAVGKGTQEAR